MDDCDERPLSERLRCWELVGQLLGQSRVAFANSNVGLSVIEDYRAGKLTAEEALDAVFGVLLHARNNQRVALGAMETFIGPDVNPDDVIHLAS